MARTLVQETDASVVLGGSGTWTTVSTDLQANGSYKSNATAGATITDNIPSGKSGVILTGLRGAALTFTATLDGVPLVDPISGTTTFTRTNAGQTAANNAQSVGLGAATAGNAKISLVLDGVTYTTANIPWNSTAATVATAVQTALPAGATITGSSGPWPGAVALTASGNLAGRWLNAYTVDSSLLTGATVTVLNQFQGHSATWYRCAFLWTALASGSAHTLVVTLVSGTLTLDEVEYFVADATTAGRLTVNGHSIAAGIGASPSSARFSTVLAGYLGMTEDNQALNGEGLAFGNSAIAQPGWIRTNPTSGASPWHDRAPVAALCMWGYNDVRTNPDATAATTNGPNLLHTIQRLRECLLRMVYSNPSVKVLVVGMNYATAATGGQGWQQANFALATAAHGLTWNQAIANLCGEPGIRGNAVFVDVFSPIAYGGADALLADGSHPSNAGHGLMALALWGKARPALFAGSSGRRGGGVFR
jgi:lysophospholipase L1-like esterase